jgi:hypothetical protein
VVPIDDVVLLLRQRTDEDYYRAVNQYGIWARTPRSAVDAPLDRVTVKHTGTRTDHRPHGLRSWR